MPYDWTFSKYTIEEMEEMRDQRKLEAEKKRQRMRQEMQPMLDKFTRL